MDVAVSLAAIRRLGSVSNRIEYSYDGRGRPLTLKTFDATHPSGRALVTDTNFNDFGRIASATFGMKAAAKKSVPLGQKLLLEHVARTTATSGKGAGGAARSGATAGGVVGNSMDKVAARASKMTARKPFGVRIRRGTHSNNWRRVENSTKTLDRTPRSLDKSERINRYWSMDTNGHSSARTFLVGFALALVVSAGFALLLCGGGSLVAGWSAFRGLPISFAAMLGAMAPHALSDMLPRFRISTLVVLGIAIAGLAVVPVAMAVDNGYVQVLAPVALFLFVGAAVTAQVLRGQPEEHSVKDVE